MNSIPKVSVVIPAYNAEAFIEQTLESVLSQTFKDYEVIVVDDGSQDKTKMVVDRYLKKHSIAGCCVRQENRGIAGARNAGIGLSRGKLIALLDHDDIWYPMKLQRMMDEFEKYPSADLICHRLNMVKGGRITGVLKMSPSSRNMYDYMLFTLRGSLLSPSAVLFRKEKASEIGGFREDPQYNSAEDFDFWLRLSRRSEFRFIDDILGEYNVVTEGASRKIISHGKSVEAVLKDHYSKYLTANSRWSKKIKARRRLSALYRSIAYNLLCGKAPSELQREYIVKMIKHYPFNVKNIIVAILWILKK
jgi:glycosyltransferase involved in cell wall biosynthesis